MNSMNICEKKIHLNDMEKKKNWSFTRFFMNHYVNNNIEMFHEYQHVIDTLIEIYFGIMSLS